MDASIVMTNLQKLPTIRKLIGDEWFHKQLCCSSNHPLIRYSSKIWPDNSEIGELVKKVKTEEKEGAYAVILIGKRIPCDTLLNLEHCLDFLEGELRIKMLVDKLMKEDEFWSAYSEIEVAYHLKKRFKSIELEPILPDRKRVDIKVNAEDRPIYVEVVTPEEGEKFKAIWEYARQKDDKIAISLPESTSRARYKIIDEMEHFRSILKNNPCLLVIDTTRCEFDEDEIGEALSGTNVFVIEKGPDALENRTYWARNMNHVFTTDPEIENLTGILEYRRGLHLEEGVIYQGTGFRISSLRDTIKITMIPYTDITLPFDTMLS